MYRLAIPSRSGNSGNQRDFNKEFAEFAETYEWDLRDLSVLFVKVFPEFRKQGGTLSPLRNIRPLLDPDAFR